MIKLAIKHHYIREENMPVFDFSGSDNKNKNIVTYETFRSSESAATAEKPIMILENTTRKWAHHSSGKFTNPIKIPFFVPFEAETLIRVLKFKYFL